MKNSVDPAKEKTTPLRTEGRLKTAFALIAIALFTALTLVFGLLYVKETEIEFIADNRLACSIGLTAVALLSSILSVVFLLTDKQLFYKLLLIFLGVASFFLGVVYFAQISGFWDKIDSVEDLREYVSSYGAFTIPAFIILQFLQVVVLPLPGMITIGAGVALFGPFFGALYSFIGITTASFAAFFIGRKLGYKVASWLVGKESLDKWLKAVENKDKVVLTFMFVFPFFPDDILCFVAGLSSMSAGYYSVMITVTRILSVYITAYSFSGNIIPYNTWWGILVWIAVFAVTATLCVLIYKNGDRIEKFFKKKFKSKGNERKNDTSR